MIKSAKIWLAACALCGAIAPFGEAYGAPPVEAKAQADALTDRAAALFDEGTALLRKGRVAEARAAFLAAWSLKQHWQIAGNLADCELRLGRYREAAEHAAYYKKNAPPDRQAKGDAQLKSAIAKVATVTLTVTPAGAEVLVDGESVGRAPFEGALYLLPGERKIAARVPGRPDAEQVVKAEEGAALAVTLTVPEAEALATPEAAVKTTRTPEESAPKPTEGPLETQGLEASKSVPILVGSAAIAVVGLGIGIGGALASVNNSGTAAELHGDLKTTGGMSACAGSANAARCEEMRSAYVDTGTFRNVAILGFVLAGAVAIGTAAYVLMPAGDAHGGVRAALSVAPGAGGLIVTGDF